MPEFSASLLHSLSDVFQIRSLHIDYQVGVALFSSCLLWWFFFSCPNLYGSALYGVSKQVLLLVGFVNPQVQLTLQVGSCREEVGG